MIVGHSGLMVAAAAAFMGGTLLLGTGGALAQTCPGVSQTQCEEFCGGAENVASCEKIQSTPDCQCEPQPKPGPGQKLGTFTQEGESGQGNLGNKTQPEPCEGNQGQCKQQ